MRTCSLLLACLLATALTLAGCGRKGPLEPPPEKSADAGKAPAPAKGAPPDRPFVLDRLLR